MKTTNKFLALAAFMAVAMVFASCSKDDNDPVGPTQQEIEAKIVGNWKELKRNGVDVLTNERQIWTYFGNGKGTNSISCYKSIEGKYIYANHKAIEYTLDGNKMYDKAIDMECYSSITSIDDTKMIATIEKLISNGMLVEKDDVVEYRKTSKDYSQDIIGMWEGVEITGYETYGNAEHRILYNADGTYVYFVKSGDNWVTSSNVDNEYNVDGDWLATRWRPEAGADYNYEWWDIDYIKDGMMKWSALREKEDGTRFTTTFTWKKVK